MDRDSGRNGDPGGACWISYKPIGVISVDVLEFALFVLVSEAVVAVAAVSRDVPLKKLKTDLRGRGTPWCL
jgi:hypothetical protein